MSESFPSRTPEAELLATDAYQVIDMLTSDVVFEQERQRIELEIQGDPDILKFGELEAAIGIESRAEYDAMLDRDDEAFIRHRDKGAELHEEKEALPEGTREKYRALEHQAHMLDMYHSRVVSQDSIEAQTILRLIGNAPKIQPPASIEPPFKDYKENTGQTWKHVSTDDVKRFTKDRILFETNSRRIGSSGKNGIQINTKRGEEIEIPLDLIVDAQGFDSWNGREGVGSGKDVSGEYAKLYDRKLHSSKVIKHYAALPTEIPPVSEIHVYVQPDGTMFADNGSGDSHRIGAAILRGQETIKAESVRISVLDRNFIIPQSQ